MNPSASFHAILLEIVVAITVLGAGSIARVAQLSGLTLQHVFPRLVPAPQAFTKDERPKRLPTESGTVVGVYSGNLRTELNFFAALLHPKKLERNAVELIEVKNKCGKNPKGQNVYHARQLGPLFLPSLLGLAASIVVLVLSVRHGDKFAIAATVMLSLSSTTIGLASRWTLDLKEREIAKEREKHIPAGDVVIYYARLGAFRVIRCDERISEMYFRMEACEYVLDEAMYRAAWLFSAMLVMASLICLKRSSPELQIAFAGSYVALNMLYWFCAALDPVSWHWSHDYQVTVKEWKSGSDGGFTVSDALTESMPPAAAFVIDDSQVESQMPRPKRTFSIPIPAVIRRATTTDSNSSPRIPEPKYTDALWTAIALVGHSKWVYHARVAPDNTPWRQWVDEAGNVAALWRYHAQRQEPTTNDEGQTSREVLTAFIDRDGAINLPAWDHKERLTDLLKAQPVHEKRAPDWKELVELRKAGYFPKGMAKAGRFDPASESMDKKGQQQGASTGTDANQPEPIRPSHSSSTHLTAQGTRLRRTHSQENRHSRPVEGVMRTEPEVLADDEEVTNSPGLSRNSSRMNIQIVGKEKNAV